MCIIPTLRRLRQVDHKSQVNLDPVDRIHPDNRSKKVKRKLATEVKEIRY